MVLIFTAGVILIAMLMCAGWGWAARCVLRLPSAGWPQTIAFGIAAVVFAGGILNLARIAYPSALLALAGIGIVLVVAALREMPLARPPLFASLLIAVIVIFTVVTQLPPGVFNFRDDFQKYLAYPVRMIETGTVFDSPFSAMGSQTLGAKAFLDAFVVAFFPIVYADGVDSVFGLLLCLMLATQFVRREMRLMSAVCLLSVIFINPQYVNISTLYIGSALIMAICMVCEGGLQPSAAALGILYAALIALKPSLGVFVAIHLLLFGVVAGLRWTIRTGFATAGFLSPWILLHSPHYLAALRHPLPRPAPFPGTIEVDHLNLFSFESLDYGATPLNYTLLILGFAVCAFLCFRVGAPRVLACCASGIVTFLVFVYVLGPLHAGYPHAVRYYTPIAIGLAPAVFGMTAMRVEKLHLPAMMWMALFAALVPVAAFTPSLSTRIQRSVQWHSAAAYPWLSTDPEYIAYSRTVLSAKESQLVRTIQSMIPAGEPVLAWMNFPFYFDYRRNRIIDIDPAGIGNPWADWDANLAKAHYLILDYAGYATPTEDDYRDEALEVGAGERRNSVLDLDFLLRIRQRMEGGEVLYDNREIKLIRLR